MLTNLPDGATYSASRIGSRTILASAQLTRPRARLASRVEEGSKPRHATRPAFVLACKVPPGSLVSSFILHLPPDSYTPAPHTTPTCDSRLDVRLESSSLSTCLTTRLYSLAQSPRDLIKRRESRHSPPNPTRLNTFHRLTVCERFLPLACSGKQQLIFAKEMLEARLEQANILKKVSYPAISRPSNPPTDKLHCRLSTPSRSSYKTATLTAMTPASHCRPWTTRMSPSSP